VALRVQHLDKKSHFLSLTSNDLRPGSRFRKGKYSVIGDKPVAICYLITFEVKKWPPVHQSSSIELAREGIVNDTVISPADLPPEKFARK
tara:strand:- start:949 stop:1218 length:270 start_codon:yes stop_codon:yes gene_type:complete